MASSLQDSPLRPLISEYQRYIDAYHGKISLERNDHQSKDAAHAKSRERLITARSNRQTIIELIRKGSTHERNLYNLLESIEKYEKIEEEEMMKQLDRTMQNADEMKTEEEAFNCEERALQANILGIQKQKTRLQCIENTKSDNTPINADQNDLLGDKADRERIASHQPSQIDDAVGLLEEKNQNAANISTQIERDKSHWEQYSIYGKMDAESARNKTPHLERMTFDCKTSKEKDDHRPSLSDMMTDSTNEIQGNGNVDSNVLKANRDNLNILLQLQKHSIEAFQNILGNNEAIQNAWETSMMKKLKKSEAANIKLATFQQNKQFYKENDDLKQDLLKKSIENNKLEHIINEQQDKIRRYENDMAGILVEYEKHYAYCKNLQAKAESSKAKCDEMETIINDQKRQLALHADWMKDSSNDPRKEAATSEAMTAEISQLKRMLKENENELANSKRDLSMARLKENGYHERADDLLNNVAELVTEQIFDKIGMDVERESYKAQIKQLEAENCQLKYVLECKDSDSMKNVTPFKVVHDAKQKHEKSITEEEDLKEEKSTFDDLTERDQMGEQHHKIERDVKKFHDKSELAMSTLSNVEIESISGIRADKNKKMDSQQELADDFNKERQELKLRNDHGTTGQIEKGIQVMLIPGEAMHFAAEVRTHELEMEITELKSEMQKKEKEFDISLDDDSERIELLVGDIESYIVKNKDLRAIICEKELEIESLTDQVYILEGNEQKLKNRIDYLDENIICLQKENAEKQLKIDSDASLFTELLHGTKPVNVSERSPKRSRSYSTFETIHCLQDRISDYWATINELKNENMEYHQRNSKLLAEIEHLNEERLQQKKKLENNEINSASYLSEIRRLEKKVKIFEDEYNKIGQRNSRYEEEIEEEHDQMVLIQNELEMTAKLKEKLQRSYDEIEEQVMKLTKQMKLLETENKSNKAKVMEYRTQLEQTTKSMSKQIARKDEELEEKQSELQNLINEYKKVAYENKDYQHKIEAFIVSFARYISTQTITTALFQVQTAELASSVKANKPCNQENIESSKRDGKDLEDSDRNDNTDEDISTIDACESEVVSKEICHSLHCLHDERRSHERLQKLSVDLQNALQAKKSDLMCIEEANERLAFEFDRVRTEIHLQLKEKDEKIKYLSAEIMDLSNEKESREICIEQLLKGTALYLTKASIQSAALQCMEETGHEIDGNQTADKANESKDEIWCIDPLQKIDGSKNGLRRVSNIIKQLKLLAEKKDVVIEKQKNKMLEMKDKDKEQIQEIADLHDLLTKCVCEVQLGRTCIEIKTKDNIHTKDGILKPRAFGDQIIKCFEKADVNIEVALDLEYATPNDNGIKKLKDFYKSSFSEVKDNFALGISQIHPQPFENTSAKEQLDGDIIQTKPLKGILKNVKSPTETNDASPKNHLKHPDVPDQTNLDDVFENDESRSGIFFKDSTGFIYAQLLIDDEDLSSLQPCPSIASQEERHSDRNANQSDEVIQQTDGQFNH